MLNAGIVSASDVVTVDGNNTGDPALANLNIENAGDGTTATVATGDQLVISRAIPGVYYKVYEDASNTVGIGKGPNYFAVSIATDKNNLTASLDKALEKSYSKIESDVDGDGTKDFLDSTAGDGAALILFK